MGQRLGYLYYSLTEPTLFYYTDKNGNEHEYAIEPTEYKKIIALVGERIMEEELTCIVGNKLSQGLWPAIVQQAKTNHNYTITCEFRLNE